jgi:16S rRNA (cytidine1402-2'-O)-methyltransferase
MTKIFYVVGTPIGNLEDLTFRAKRILGEIDFLISENPLTTKKLFDAYKLKWKPNIKLNEQNFNRQLPKLRSIFNSFSQIAYTTSAGTPGLSDPGNRLVAFVRTEHPDFKITPVPGVSALTTAISIAGVNLQQFTFFGFLPKKGRAKFIHEIGVSSRPVVLFESPLRLSKLLTELRPYKKKILICRELTKKFEEIYWYNLDEDLQAGVRGELTLIVMPSR